MELPEAVPADKPVSLKLLIGILAVIVCVPSFRTQVERPVAISAVKALKTVELITVPVTTGWPELLIVNVPLENDISIPRF